MRRLLAILAAISGFIALLFRAKSKQHQAEAKQATARTEQSEAITDIHRKTDSAVTQVKQKHREEQADAQARLDAGQRDHLSDDW